MKSKLIQTKELFKKEGGFGLIRQLHKTRILSSVLGCSLFLGMSHKSLEIVRLIIQYKTKLRLKKRYNYVLRKCKEFDHSSLNKEQSNYVWICWFQGIENAPLIVQKCVSSLKENLSDKKVTILNFENINEYVTFPPIINEKWEKGIISNTHLSDILRIELLIKYGGTWIDSTVLCTGKNFPDYLFKSDLFFFQLLKPGLNGQSLSLSSWFITSSSNNYILLITRELIYEYWKKNKIMANYFLFHMFLEIVLDEFPEERKKIMKFCNSIPHMLLLDLFEPFDKEKFENVERLTAFHKLNYKFDTEKFLLKGTFYDEIFNNNFINSKNP